MQINSHAGVERLMNLVINLYKEQSTIKGFEESVRSLKSDIAKELKSSPNNKEQVVKELRSEIQNTAAKKLEGFLIYSIYLLFIYLKLFIFKKKSLQLIQY